MIFWRNKKNAKEQEAQDKEDKLLHHKNDPAIEPPTEYDSDLSEDQKHKFNHGDDHVIDDLDSSPVPIHNPVADTKEARELADHTDEGGWLSRLSSGLKKSSKKFTDILTKDKLDDEALEQLEDHLIQADLGPKTAAEIVSRFASTRFGKDVDDDEVRNVLAELMENILTPVARPIPQYDGDGVQVILVTGVNGVGKTTTIGKLAKQYQRQGKKVMMAAADTFRAAAVDQLKIWGERNHCTVVTKDVGADPAAVAYDAIERAKSEKADILLIDTAGRLHNKKNLMEELQKIIRVVQKQDKTAPHSTLLVLDATTGQNAIAQVETFKTLVNVSGLVVTKLDGSSKGGIVVALADQFAIPVHAVGVGEGINDLQPFTAKSYARSLVGLED